nr:reverse transcriptase domain-containing protein [Tanacetum cinerariifolium]
SAWASCGKWGWLCDRGGCRESWVAGSGLWGFTGFWREKGKGMNSKFKRGLQGLWSSKVIIGFAYLVLVYYNFGRNVLVRPMIEFDKLADQISNLVEIVNKQVITLATVKAVEKTCVICGGAHAYYDCIAADSNQPSVYAATGTYNQVSLPNRASNQIPPPGFASVQNSQIRSITRPKGVFEDVFVKVGKFHFPTDFVVVDFEVDPRVPLIRGRSFLRTGHALIDVYGEEITLMVNDESVTFNLNQTMRYSSTYDDNSVNRVDIIGIACEEFVQDVLDFQYNTKSRIRPCDFFLEEIKDFLNDESIPMGIENSFYDPEGDILYLEKFLNEDPFQLPLMDLKQAEETKAKSSIEEPPELELKELPAKVDVIAKLPHSTTVKGVRSFLGHAGFYQRFIQDFSKIARPMTHLLEKETPFVFSKECIDAFDTLKKNLTEAPILAVPDWNLPFE